MPERHRSKSTKKNASARASAKGCQPGSGSDYEEKNRKITCQRDMTGPVDRALGEVIIPEVPPVEKALRRAREKAPTAVPRRDVDLEACG